jgi:pilus retraction protein PilT
VFLIDEVKRRLGVPAVKMVVVTAFDVRGALEIVGDTTSKTEDVQMILKDVQEADVQVEKRSDQEVDLEKQAGESPVIRYVNFIIQSAVKEGASDIHIEPGDKKVRVRFRIDGELFEMGQPPASMVAAITSRLKIMGNLDISERRLPQDGRIRCAVQGRKLDLRMSTIPTAYGEKVVLRILDTRSINVKLEELGFDDDTLERWRRLIDAPHGIVLVTGPTGSGKTTSLASMINIINEERDDAHIITIEDPIEYYHKHKKAVITQREINVDVPNFAEALRRALRQDPDVILVGEMRDLETIDAAITAAETGHLVFGTLHTTGAAKTIDRVVNAFPVNQQEQIRIQLSTVLQAVISQLLLPRCDKPGRVAIFEIMINTPSIAALIRDNKTFRIQSDIQTGAKYGMVTLDSFLLEKYQAGMISQEEVITKAQDPTTILQKLQELEAGRTLEEASRR